MRNNDYCNMKPYELIAVVQPGLEKMAEKELRELGYNDLRIIRGGILLKGHQSTIMKLNLACRCISRVLIGLAEFKAKSFAELETELEQIPWQDYLKDQNICIRVTSRQSSLYHERAIEERLLATLSCVLGKTISFVGSPDEENTQLIVIHARHDVFSVRLDTSGAHLHKRGYGLYKEDAPLRETVAAAFLKKIGWSENIFCLCDPLCGSGTIPLEAAVMAARIPLCEFRQFSFQKWPSFQPEVFVKIRQTFMDKMIQQPKVKILASDLDAKAVNSAIANAQSAGVDKLIQFARADLKNLHIDKNYIVVTNPPWGKRMDSSQIKNIWMKLHSIVKCGSKVYLVLAENQISEFRYKFKTLLRFTAGEMKLRFIKLEA